MDTDKGTDRMRHIRPGFLALLVPLAIALAGCSPWFPDQAEILVNTLPPGASCVLSRGGQPIATAAPTPAIGLVDPSEAPVTVSCRRPGFQDAAVTVVARLPERGYGFLLFAPTPPYEGQRIDIAMVPR